MAKSEKALLMGNAAIALGALRAGVSFVSGYAGTPSTEIIETMIKIKPKGVHIEWSINEKAAVETAAGAALAGGYALAVMKQVGLNVATDPLMSLNYIGLKGALVLAAADDPGPSSSQTEQDTRIYGKFANIMVFDPTSPREAYLMIADAFYFSHKFGRPVILRPTTRLCHGYEVVETEEPLDRPIAQGFTKEGGRWVIFPRLAYLNHVKLEAEQIELSELFSDYRGNTLIKADAAKRGIACGGVSYHYVIEALQGIEGECSILKVSTFPFPKKLARAFLEGLDEILIVEELDPYIEEEMIALAGDRRVYGKLSGDMPLAGEYLPDLVKKAVYNFLGKTRLLKPPLFSEDPPPALPIRPPVLCAGCPHRGSFYAVKIGVKQLLREQTFKKAVFSGDIGCYTLGNAAPLDMLDACLCMGAGITMAQGLNRVEKETLNIAFIGDSTFFHTGIPGIINALYNSAEILVIVLDNAVTAMTGGQGHPGTGISALNSSAPIDISRLLSGLGITAKSVSAFDVSSAAALVREAAKERGVRVIIFHGACAALEKRGADDCWVDSEVCTGCGICVKRLGCPALTMRGGSAFIDNGLCFPCTLCASICPVGAIKRG
ncbi:MAG: hypothetical protein LBP51_04455 [Deferribacteraceae bacterium]|jgi:indolepyruvate ferredoxin oxidoreductase alpha subunit|nr:hypothetical protein [Deferribacteraceae bacterium]